MVFDIEKMITKFLCWSLSRLVMVRLILLSLFLLNLSQAVMAQSGPYQKRLALIIGNSNYKAGMQLKNPANDARAMGSTLQTLGFDVLQHENLTLEGLKQAIKDFGLKLKGYDVGLFFYAGHGIQYHGHNYMIPIEANLENEDEVEIGCLPADRVLTFMELAQTKVNLIILDACRNNPFERSWSRSSSGSGLAMMDAPRGTLIAYATSPGSTASDGEGDNGLFTSAILRYIQNESLTIEQVFKRVRTDVEERSNKRQSPWEATSLSGEDLYMAKGFGGAKRASSLVRTESISATDIQEAEKYYQSGVQKFGAKLFNDALYDLTHSLELNPYSAETQYSMGRLHLELKMTDQALSDFTRSIALKPEMGIAYVWRGTVLYSMKKYQEAADNFDVASKLAPKTADYRYSWGLALYQMKKYEEAINAFTQALNITPTNTNSRFYRAMSYYFSNQLEKADADFELVLKENPENATALLYHALILTVTNPENALEALSAVISKSPEEPMPYVERGILHFKNGDFQGATDDLNKAITIDNSLAKAIYWKGRLFFEASNWNDALYSMNTVLDIDSTFHEAYAWRGFIRVFENRLKMGEIFAESSVKKKKSELENFELALKDFEKAIKINGQDPENYYRRGLVMLDADKNEEAVRDFKQAVAIKPGFAEGWLALGRVRLEQGAYPEASIHLTKSMNLIPKNLEALYWRGECSLRMNFLQQAINDFSKALQFNPGFTKALLKRGDTYKVMGNAESAIADYTAALESPFTDKAMILQKRADAYLLAGKGQLAIDDTDKSLILLKHSQTKTNPMTEVKRISIRDLASSDPEVAKKMAAGAYIQAQAYELLGKKSYAQDLATRSVNLDPDNKVYETYWNKLRKD